MRWMKLEPIIQSEVSQKDKDHYSILTHIYMEFRKMITITLYAKQKKRHRCIEQTFGLCERRRGWDVSREQPFGFKHKLRLSFKGYSGPTLPKPNRERHPGEQKIFPLTVQERLEATPRKIYMAIN